MTKFEKDFRIFLDIAGDKVKYPHYFYWSNFSAMPDSMKWGVYVDFFDSVGIVVSVFSEAEYPDVYFDYRIHEKKEASIWGRATIAGFKTRSEASKAALEKTIELYNSKP